MCYYENVLLLYPCLDSLKFSHWTDIQLIKNIMSHVNLLDALIRNVQISVARAPKLSSIAKGL